jgi:hypothetical protein
MKQKPILKMDKIGHKVSCKNYGRFSNKFCKFLKNSILTLPYKDQTK